VLFWTVETLNDLVDSEIAGLPADLRARLVRIAELIVEHGPDRLPRAYARHLEGKLWELRVKGPDGIARAIYVTVSGRRVIILRVFVKKTQKTPPRELELARRRAREIA
jgi:phage-related protein